MPATILTYEQPVNEHLRACLRLERLFQQAEYGLHHGTSIWDSRLTISALLDILNVLERPDIKTKVIKELSKHLHSLSRLEKTPQIDSNKLADVLVQLEDAIDVLHSTGGKIAQELRDNDFLNAIRQHLLMPGSTSSSDTPVYHLWLHQPPSTRTADLMRWLKPLKNIQSAIDLLLMLTRQSCAPQEKIAHAGFFQAALDPQAPCQLIRVVIARELNVYPEISVGRHGICVRFFPLFTHAREMQVTRDIPFKLTTCIF